MSPYVDSPSLSLRRDHPVYFHEYFYGWWYSEPSPFLVFFFFLKRDKRTENGIFRRANAARTSTRNLRDFSHFAFFCVLHSEHGAGGETVTVAVRPPAVTINVTARVTRFVRLSDEIEIRYEPPAPPPHLPTARPTARRRFQPFCRSSARPATRLQVTFKILF